MSRAKFNPVGFVSEHPWMTLILGLAAIGVVGTAVRPVCACDALPATPPTPPTPAPAPAVPTVTGTSGLGAIHGDPFAGVFRQLGMRR